MPFGPQTPFLDPDNFLYGMHYPGESKNQSHVDDPVVTDIQLPSGIYVTVWDGASKNYGPNLGYDYGGRLMAAWLDR